MIRQRFAIVILALIGLPGWTPAAANVEIQEVTSPGGITAWLVQDNSIPFLSLDIRFEGGSSLDRPGKRGSIYMMTGLLEEGTGELDAQGLLIATHPCLVSPMFWAQPTASPMRACGSGAVASVAS